MSQGSRTTIHGRVLRQGQPLAGAFVQVNGPSGDFVGEVRSTPAGAYRLHVDGGTWTVLVRAPGVGRLERSVTLSPGDRLEVDLDLI